MFHQFHTLTNTGKHTCPTMDDVFPTLVHLSIDEGLADIGSSREYPQGTSLTVINTRHRLLGVNIHQCHVSSWIRHQTLDLHLVVGQDMVAIRHR